MTKKSKSTLITQAGVIKTETGADLNTATRIGTMNEDAVDSSMNELDEGFVQVEYGSASDQSATIQAAIDAASGGDILRFKNGVVKVETQINVDKKLTIIGYSNTVFQTTSDIKIFNVTNRECLFREISFLGDAAAEGVSAKTNQIGVFAEDIFDIFIENITANNMGGSSIKLGGTIGAQFQSRDGGYISNCKAYDCNISYHLDFRAEYLKIVNCISVNHQKGIKITGGNVSVIGGNYSDGVIGIEMIGDTNSGHGVLSGVVANHNTSQNLYIDELLGLGEAISNCAFWSGDIYIRRGDVINITGCTINAPVFEVDFETIIMSNNYMHDTPAATLTNGANIIKNHNYTSAKVLW